MASGSGLQIGLASGAFIGMVGCAIRTWCAAKPAPTKPMMTNDQKVLLLLVFIIFCLVIRILCMIRSQNDGSGSCPASSDPCCLPCTQPPAPQPSSCTPCCPPSAPTTIQDPNGNGGGYNQDLCCGQTEPGEIKLFGGKESAEDKAYKAKYGDTNQVQAIVPRYKRDPGRFEAPLISYVPGTDAKDFQAPRDGPKPFQFFAAQPARRAWYQNSSLKSGLVGLLGSLMMLLYSLLRLKEGGLFFQPPPERSGLVQSLFKFRSSAAPQPRLDMTTGYLLVSVFATSTIILMLDRQSILPRL